MPNHFPNPPRDPSFSGPFAEEGRIGRRLWLRSWFLKPVPTAFRSATGMFGAGDARKVTVYTTDKEWARLGLDLKIELIR